MCKHVAGAFRFGVYNIALLARLLFIMSLFANLKSSLIYYEIKTLWYKKKYGL